MEHPYLTDEHNVIYPPKGYCVMIGEVLVGPVATADEAWELWKSASIVTVGSHYGPKWAG